MTVEVIKMKMKTGKKMKSSQKAFTLLESLIVLTLFSFLLSVFNIGVNRTLHQLRGELFLIRFEHVLQSRQVLASAKQEAQIITVSKQQLRFSHKSYAVPKELHFKDFSLTFDEKGNNSSLAKIEIKLPYEDLSINYQMEMGSGKYQKKKITSLYSSRKSD